MSLTLIYTTVSTRKEAEQIATTLINEKLAACVNMVSENTLSFYKWQNELKQEWEKILLIKTKKSLEDEVIARIKELHSYECPCIMTIPIDKVNEEYAKWIEENTA